MKTKSQQKNIKVEMNQGEGKLLITLRKKDALELIDAIRLHFTFNSRKPYMMDFGQMEKIE